MPKIDPDGMHPKLLASLRAALDRVTPPHSQPRYTSARAPLRSWRLAPVALCFACAGIIALTAFAATGSPNPAVWTNRVQTVISEPSPSPTPTEAPTPSHAPSTPAAATTHPPAVEPEPTSSPEHESPEPNDDHESPGHSASPAPSPSPSPSGDR